MLQLALATGTLAAGGERHRPHLVREVVDVVNNERRAIGTERMEPVPMKPEHLAEIRRALVGVNLEGTSAGTFRGAPYTSGGKTGTAQVIAIKQGEKYNAAKLAEHHRDHALYMAYAPADDPKIAVALIVENAGFGAQNAAPIARRVFDYWVAGLYPTDEDIAAVQQGQSPAPLKPPRPLASVVFAKSPAASAVPAAAAALVAASAPVAAGASAPPAAAAAASAHRGAVPPARLAASAPGNRVPPARALPAAASGVMR
jgi:penicillin-binding protein 2